MSAQAPYAGGPYAGSSAAATAPSPITPLIPTLQLVFSPTTGPYETPTWVDITSRLRSRTPITIRRGREHALDEITAGTMTLELDNQDRVFDPSYASGAYYGNLGPNTLIQLRAVWETVTYYLFTGLIDGLEQRYDRSDRDATVTVRCTDLFRLLARRDFRPRNTFTLDRTDGSSRLDNGQHFADNIPALERQFTGDRIDHVLHVIGIDTVSVDQGGSSLVTEAPDDEFVLPYLNRCARTDLGRFFIAANGTPTFHDRHHARTATVGATSQITLGDSSAHTVRYHDLRFDPADERVMVNHARCGRAGKKPAVARDLTSIDRHGEQTADREDLLFADMLDAADQARYLVARYASPSARIDRVVLKPRRFPSSLWPAVLGYELGTRVTVERTPMDIGSVFSQACLIEAVEHRIDLSRLDWTTSWSLAKADTTTYFRLDRTDGSSRCDNNVLLGY